MQRLYMERIRPLAQSFRAAPANDIGAHVFDWSIQRRHLAAASRETLPVEPLHQRFDILKYIVRCNVSTKTPIRNVSTTSYKS